ncbi:hypothetical protein M413DRAFT_271953 [Hebeloma cylindrosporum]|uniref:Uncharacterized protein n=1 Tax=Hebeloma cylindrosporum TaxID=76867 RepID=A0A0C2YBQ7_HEBCY|nr:hypothetical protein M413DRAFT_271953 [Hebeloma cylindrosporum h7]
MSPCLATRHLDPLFRLDLPNDMEPHTIESEPAAPQVFNSHPPLSYNIWTQPTPVPPNLHPDDAPRPASEETEDGVASVRWPSGLRRQTKDQGSYCPWISGPPGRGFESHPHQTFCYPFGPCSITGYARRLKTDYW